MNVSCFTCDFATIAIPLNEHLTNTDEEEKKKSSKIKLVVHMKMHLKHAFSISHIEMTMKKSRLKYIC